MSTTNHTPTIELSQYVGTDKTSYLVNYNNDMLAIDGAIATDRDNITTAQATGDRAEGKADTNKASIDTINTTLNDPSTGLIARVGHTEGDISTINSLIGNGEPTTQDKTIIGAINELAAEIPSGGVDADDVSYDNTTSGLSATNVQDAIDEIVGAGSGAEVVTGTLATGSTSATLTTTNIHIGASSLISFFADGGLEFNSYSISGDAVTFTFDAQLSDVAIAMKVENV